MSLARRIERQPADAPALVCGRRRLTYGALNRAVAHRAEQLAGGPVYVLLDHPRGIAWIVDLLAGWQADRVPVLVDPLDPPSRRAALLAQLEAFEPPPRTAYIAFTSGSSGMPKGVALGSPGLEQMVDAQIGAFELGPGCRAGWMLHPGFDASLSDVLTTLVSGAELTVHVGEGHDLGWLDGLTHLDLPPVLLPALLARGLPETLGTIVFGGELAHEATVRRLAAHRRLFNLYGPTETTVCSSIKRCDERWNAGDIGEPIPGTGFHLRDGELWISGHGVALASLSADDSRFGNIDGVRAFRTGDRVEWRDGELTFVGRLDRQVQIRGKRVQLEAIESVMRRIPGVQAARAAVEGHRLVANYEGPATADEVQAALAGMLRPHEIPRVRCGALPRSPRLKATDPIRPTHSTERRPTHSTEPGVAALLEVVAQVLPGVTTLGPETPIGALGLDSVERLTISTLAQQRGLCLEPTDLEDARTVRDVVGDGGASARTVAQLEALARAVVDGLPRDTEHPTAGCGVLLSGGSGLLGTSLIDALLELEIGPIHCLVRATPPTHAVATVSGDVSKPMWGLDAPAIEQLRGTIGHVVHLAGRVDLTRGYESLAPVNVLGTAHAITLANALGARLHVASSLSVFAESEATGAFEPATPLEAAGSVRGGYAQSKWVAEAVVREAAPNATISRLGLLVPEGPGRADQLSRVIRGLASLGGAPAVQGKSLAFDCTPVRCAAQALAQVIAQGQGTYHIANPNSARAADLLAALDLPVCDPWPGRAPADADESVAVAAFRRAQGHAGFAGDLFLATDRRFVCPRAWALAGVEPPVPDAAFVRALVDQIGGNP